MMLTSLDKNLGGFPPSIPPAVSTHLCQLAIQTHVQGEILWEDDNNHQVSLSL